jgi:hypothetical protein
VAHTLSMQAALMHWDDFVQLAPEGSSSRHAPSWQ